VASESHHNSNVTNQDPGYWTWEEIATLPIPDIASSPCFVFMWVGDGDGLDRGREILAKWGFRRCEDIVWIKTNRAMDASMALQHPAMTRWNDTRQEQIGLFQQTKEHCLMGIKGTARRSTDSHLIHCNIDTDVIIAEEAWDGSPRKPTEIYHIMEHFSNGRRRLELFGEDHTIRRGWVTLGKDLTRNSGYNPRHYRSQFEQEPMGHLLGKNDVIEQLRPKTPPPGSR
jgi:mRNA m6A methyltransferase non-catalytic subunit